MVPHLGAKINIANSTIFDGLMSAYPPLVLIWELPLLILELPLLMEATNAYLGNSKNKANLAKLNLILD